MFSLWNYPSLNSHYSLLTSKKKETHFHGFRITREMGDGGKVVINESQVGPSRRTSPIHAGQVQRTYGANDHMHYSNFNFNAITSFTLISPLHFHILLCSASERREKFAYIALFFTHLGPVLFFYFFFAEAGSHFISLIISLSTTSHKEIANKYFLLFVVGLFFRSASYSPIFTHLGRQNCRSVHLLCNKIFWDPVIDIKQSFISHRNILYTLQTSSLTLFSFAE